GLVSPPDSRRTSDHKTEVPPLQTTQPHRQSLPSIHEALNPNPYTSPVSASLPPSHGQLPYHQGPPIPRTYPPSDHAPYPAQVAPSQARPASPLRRIHPQANPFARSEPPPDSFPDAPRPPSISSQPPTEPHFHYPGSRYELPRYEADPRAPDRAPNGYAPPPPPPLAPYQFPPSPGHLPGPQEAPYNQGQYLLPRDPRVIEAPWKGGVEEDRSRMVKQGLNHRFLVWDIENYLSSVRSVALDSITHLLTEGQVNVSSNAILNWSSHYHSITQEQQPRDPSGVPDRMPSLGSCDEMIDHLDNIRKYLEKMKSMISQQHAHAAMVDQHMRENGGKRPYYDDEMSMYGEDLKSQGYGGPDNRKRRGRAVPPGRCHSCNRAETPEWRRGPDGARTLCNACGLHYAKLTRRDKMKQSQSSNGSALRPKSMDDVSP
ncbi:hypothetical protein BJ875DRAFT_342507, partial [Amylocarpus encephaloides]